VASSAADQQQRWYGTQDGYPPADLPAGWPNLHGHNSSPLGPLPAGFSTPLPPPVLPPGELDTVTGPISLSTSVRRDRAADEQAGYGYGFEGYAHPEHADPAGYDRGYAAGFAYPQDGGGATAGGTWDDDTDYTDYAAADDGTLYGAPMTPSVPPGTTFVAATQAARAPRFGGASAFGAGPGGDARTAGRRGTPGGGGGRAKSDKSDGQRSSGAHRAPVGRPGSARAKLAVASTASLAGLSALVGSAVLATDTGPLVIPAGPGSGTSTGQFPSVQTTGSGGDTAAANAASPITPGLTPLAPNGGQQPAGQDDAPNGYDPTLALDSFAPMYDDPSTDASADSPYPTGGLGGQVPVVPLLPRDSMAGTPAAAPTAAAPSTPSTAAPMTGNPAFDWFGIGEDPSSPTPAPTDSSGQAYYPTPAPDATDDPTTAPTDDAGQTPPTDQGQPQATEGGTAEPQDSSAPPTTGSDAPAPDSPDSLPADPISVVKLDPLEDADYFTKATIGWFS